MEEKTDDIILKNNTEQIVSLIRSSLSVHEKRIQLNDYHDNDIADVFDVLTAEERKSLYSILGLDRTSEIFAYLEEDVGKYLEELDNERAADIIESMDSEDRKSVV